jgi:hypothetical protein
VFGEKAVLRRGGEARAATAVALSPVTIVSINKWRYDAVMEAAERTESREVAEFLRETELFPESRVSDADLTELASRLAVIRANPGDTIVAAGDHAKGVFFVRVGRAKVSAVAKVMVESPDIVVGPDDLRASVQSLRSSHDSVVPPWEPPRFARDRAAAEVTGDGRRRTSYVTCRWGIW